MIALVCVYAVKPIAVLLALLYKFLADGALALAGQATSAKAPVLGFSCSLFAVLPLVGTPLVWIPVALGLFFTGATVIGAVEFFIGPTFAKLGRFKLPSSLILLSMFGGPQSDPEPGTP